ncbi:MAG: peptidylprolyl isomerase [Chloroflexota bacterium]
MSKQQIQPGRSPTRKQIAHSKREQEQLRFIYIGLGTVVGLILLVLAFGLIQTYVIEPNAPVAVVGGTEITVRDYQNRVKYERFMLDAQLEQIQQQMAVLSQQAGDNQELASLLGQQYQQMANQLAQQRSVVDRQTVDTMIDDQLIAAEASARGITVSEEEVTEAINRFLSRQLGGLTAAAASETATARVEASATAALWTPTPTFTPSPTLTATETITQPTPPPGPAPAPANTSTPAPTPTLNVIGGDKLGTEYTTWLSTLADQVGIDEATYRQIIRAFVLRDKLGEDLADEAPTSAEQAHARHILVETEAEAQDVIKRLNAGEDFAELAAELSTDPGSAAQGGDLGFVTRGAFVGPVDEAVFTLPIGQVSEPVQTQFGWHVIEVLAREVRELSPLDYQQSQRLALPNWLEETRAKADIQDLWTADKAPKDSLAPAF